MPVGQRYFPAQLVFERLPGACQVYLVAIYQYFGGTSPAIVIGTHGKSVGPGTQHRQQIAIHNGQLPLPAQEIACFTHRPDNIINPRGRILPEPDRDNVQPGLIERGAQHVVHCRIDDGEIVLSC